MVNIHQLILVYRKIAFPQDAITIENEACLLLGGDRFCSCCLFHQWWSCINLRYCLNPL